MLTFFLMRRVRLDKKLISLFWKETPLICDDFVQDFLGTREYFAYAVERLRYQIDQSHPKKLIVDENYFEWIDLLESVISAQDSFTFVEVGSGYGRWSARAYKAAKNIGFENKDITLITIEPEPYKTSMYKEHFSLNQIPDICCHHFQCAVSDYEGDANLYSVRPGKELQSESYEWYGQAIAYSDWEGAMKIPVQVQRLSNILQRFTDREINLIDFDIQGEEPKVLPDIQNTLEHVHKVRIGTNSAKDERFIRKFFSSLGWEKTRDYRGSGWRRTYAGPVRFVDGVLSFVNPRYGAH